MHKGTLSDVLSNTGVEDCLNEHLMVSTISFHPPTMCRVLSYNDVLSKC